MTKMWLFFGMLAVSLWAIDNVIASVLVRCYEKSEITLSWFIGSMQTLFLYPILVFFYWPRLIIDPYWIAIFFAVGAFSYSGWVLFYYILKRIDTSVSNMAWAMLAIFVSIGGLIFFKEIWSVLQIVGVVLSLSGVFIISYWHKHVSISRTLFLLSILGFINAPYFLVQKAALLNGINVFAVFLYPFISASIVAFLIPMFTRHRSSIFCRCRNLSFWFIFLCSLLSVISAAGFYFISIAYSLAPASLVVMVENIQPFLVMFFAWLVSRLIPKYAPKELLTTQSVQVKLVSFCVVFAGLTLLSMG